MFGTYVVDQNWRVLTAKYTEVEPYPWLEKLEKNAKKIAPEIDKGFNHDLQGENDRKSALYSEWWGLQGLNLWPYECESYALASWAKSPICGIIIPWI